MMEDDWFWKISPIKVWNCTQSTWTLKLLELRLSLSNGMNHWRRSLRIEIVILIHRHKFSPLNWNVFYWVFICLPTIIIINCVSSSSKESITTIAFVLLIVLLKQDNALITIALLMILILMSGIYELFIWLNSRMDLILWIIRNWVNLVVRSFFH